MNFPDRFTTSALASDVRSLPDGEAIRLAGRIVLWRPFGGLAFGQLQDRSGRVQVALRREKLGDVVFDEYAAALALGDFVGVEGVVWTTNKQERTLDIRRMSVLNKVHRNLPTKWQGISDPEVRYRKRSLDLISNPASLERFRVRSAFVTALRRILDEADFVEVETPILQPAASGASAQPFETHHNRLDQRLYLRISPETYLKRVVAGGVERVYELGRNFRNEGVDRSHLQEFTMVEWYASYWNYDDNMRFTQELIQRALGMVLGTCEMRCGDNILKFGGNWPVLDYRDTLQEKTGIDLRSIGSDVDRLRDAISRGPFAGLVDTSAPFGQVVDRLYKVAVRPDLMQPCFLVHHPVELAPLARQSADDPTQVDMFQVVANGWELVKGYSELIDPIEQRLRLEEQSRLRQAGDEEAMMLEEDFLEVMEYGMPPMSGVGLGVDRMVALITGASSLRDVVLFPALRL